MPFVIDVDPVAFTLLGVLPVRWYGLILVLAAAVAITLTRREAHRRGLEDAVVIDAIWWVAIAALRALVDQGELKAKTVAEAIAKYGIDPSKPDPTTV